jgi:Arc/MetJ family transcription regulator
MAARDVEAVLREREHERLYRAEKRTRHADRKKNPCTVWHACHTPAMKMTMHINEDILDEVVKITGVASKTKAVETALTELVRRNRLKTKLSKGLGLTASELKEAWEDPFPEESAKVAEPPAKYGRKRARR